MDNSVSITIVGLGSGDPDQLTLGVWNRLKSAKQLYLRTAQHPAVKLLDEHQIDYQTFDAVYEQYDTFAEVYEAIVQQLLNAAEVSDDLVYAVPGHPMVAESTVQLLREYAGERITLQILGGESFLDQTFLKLGFDPIDGFQLLDGSQLEAAALDPQLHTIIAQVYDQYTASDVKLSLMELYPDDYQITVAHALGVAGEEEIVTVPLYELDRISGYGNLSLIWVSRTNEAIVRNRQFSRLKEIIKILRSPNGCPWDREQTHKSIRKNLIEEVYEVIETIDDDDPVSMCEELGDLLLQIMLHSEMEEEAGAFTVNDVIAGINEKLIRRHPHVFGSKQAGDSQEALHNWQEIKAEEKRQQGIDVEKQSILAGIPRDLPALMKAYELQKRASKVGFDWPELQEVFDKIEEELGELKEVAERPEGLELQKEELGDLLFAVINASRFIGLDPDEVLSRTNRKFTKRFEYIEQQLRLKEKSFDQTDLIEMENWWQEAKNLNSTN